MSVSAADVKALRDRTNLPMMDCKAALVETGGDMEKAIEHLRKKFKDAAVKRGDRETAEGRIAVVVDEAKKVGTILELRCESAPVAKSEHFVALANDLVQAVVAQAPQDAAALLETRTASGKSVQERIEETVGLLRENMKPARFVRLEGLLGSYQHHDGSVGVLLQVEGAKGDAEVLRDVCMHIAARNPVAGTRDEVPPATLEKEKEIAQEQIKNDPKNANKPANILEKIIEGKIKTWLAENVLLDQPFVKDDSKTVGQLLQGAGLTLKRFVRFRVGELS